MAESSAQLAQVAQPEVHFARCIVMVALFIRIQSLQLPELRKAVEAQEWAEGAAVMGRIRRLVGCNLLIGLALVAIAGARPIF